MAVRSMGARDFWQQLDRQKSLEQDEPDYFKRGSTFRSSCNSVPRTELQPLSPYLHGPVWGSIYCTIRDRSRGRGRSASLTRGTASIKTSQSPRSTSLSTNDRSSTGRTNRPKMAQNGTTVLPTDVPQTKYTAPKRYETTCYFMPLAVPVWYSTSVTIKMNSTKRNYKETVNYQKKLVPYRFVETMTTETNRDAPPVLYMSEVNIDSAVPAGEHYMSLESQQDAALAKPFATNHHIEVESHS